ncbi:MAG: hypothetical protein JNJ70_17920 [Verrucomicrobiales bacterium]|nr:hypothetical protein [Verrucomicrobiales bacterium]
MTEDEFGGGVARGSERLAGAGEGSGGFTVGIEVEALGDAEVGDVWPTCRIEENIRRLEVAMEDPALVRVRHRESDLAKTKGGLPTGEGMILRRCLEARSFDMVHAEPREAVRFPDLVDGDDAGMFQPRDRLRFAAETLFLLCRGETRIEKHLHRDGTVQVPLERPIDHAHATASDFIEQIISSKNGPRSPPRVGRDLILVSIDREKEETSGTVTRQGPGRQRITARGTGSGEGRF